MNGITRTDVILENLFVLSQDLIDCIRNENPQRMRRIVLQWQRAYCKAQEAGRRLPWPGERDIPGYKLANPGKYRLNPKEIENLVFPVIDAIEKKRGNIYGDRQRR